MSEHDEHDDPLIADLRGLFARADAVPPLVVEAGKAAYGWRRLDADLAELLSDSAVDENALAGVRGGGAPIRRVSFRAPGALAIDVEIHPADAELELLGQLAPAARARIDVHNVDGTVLATAESDTLGRFRTRLKRGGPVRLRLALEGSTSAKGVETSWITV